MADLKDTKRRLAHFLEKGEVFSVNGNPVALSARSICLHGDGPNAVELACAIGEGLKAASFQLAALEPGLTISEQAAQ